MRKVTRGRNIDTLFVLIVFGIFAFSVLMVLMLGASIYRNINDISRGGQDERLVLSYVRTKIRNFDEAGGVYVDQFNGVPALVINERLGETDFNTFIYNHNGWLYELFSEASLEFSPGDGVRIAQINNVQFEEDAGGLIKVSAGNFSILLFPRSNYDISSASLEGRAG